MPNPLRYGLILMVILIAVGAGFFLAEPQVKSKALSETTKLSRPQAHVPAMTATQTRDDVAEEKPFWEEAVIAEPTTVREPTEAVVMLPAGPAVQRDYAAEMKGLENAGKPQQLQDTLLLWFDQDAQAATAWVNETNRFEELGASLGSLAQNIANRGHLDTALHWAESITDPVVKHDTRMRIYAQEARRRRVDGESLKQAGFEPQDIETILSGALGD